jgi:hypothetical protein
MANTESPTIATPFPMLVQHYLSLILTQTRPPNRIVFLKLLYDFKPKQFAIESDRRRNILDI